MAEKKYRIRLSKKKEKTPYEKRMEERKKGNLNTKEMAKSEKVDRSLNRFDPLLKGTDRGGYTKQFRQKGRKEVRDWWLKNKK